MRLSSDSQLICDLSLYLKFDKDLKILDGSREWENKYSIKEEQLLNKNLIEILTDKSLMILRTLLDQMVTFPANNEIVELEIIHPGGYALWMNWNIHCIDGNYYSICQDISKWKSFEVESSLVEKYRGC